MGKPGLYRFVATGNQGIVVEALDGGKRTRLPVHANVSTLADVSFYTEAEEYPLWKALNTMREHEDAIRAIEKRTPKTEVVAIFEKVVPGYDQLRVYENDMRKAFKWFLILTDAGMTDFSPTESEEDEAEGHENPEQNGETAAE